MARRCKIPILTFVGYIEGAPEAEEEHDQPQVNRIVVTSQSKDAQVTTASQGDRNQAARSMAEANLQTPEMNWDMDNGRHGEDEHNIKHYDS